MLSSLVAALLTLLAIAPTSLAHFDLLDTLDDCWQECLENTGNGCDSGKCICNASQGDSYLPDAISCMVSDCDANELALQVFFLTPLELWCSVADNPIPDEVVSSAYVAVTATGGPEPVTTREVQHSKTEVSNSRSGEGDSITAIVTSTLTRTTMDDDGNTLQLFIPVVVGPNTINYGKTITSMVEAEPSSTDAPSSAAASPSQTPEVPAPASTQVPQDQSQSPTAPAEEPQRTSNSNDDVNNDMLFENMQAGAGRWSVPGILIGMGVVAGIFMRL
ncbi:hypothetical protein CC78DRAFT_259895 [Lojkania enalia]|uniref:Extracellular membrane protein CFEM domain-containing protein n=1 Tax=Lojkania enalia TaxID=147567 RepID=A0A9P4K938_9PLEO|nr:hypothetical protein CC78DRAFT_259895 [Didymosphaeria enalia]